jgi:hypothetical protein
MQAKLICGVIFPNKELHDKAIKSLTEIYGEIDKESPEYSFTEFTDYYAPEMGSGLKRKFLVFKKLIEMEQLPDIKLKTIEIEKQMSKQGKRTVNLDPGYLTENQFVLASIKTSPNKIYLAKGVSAQLILQISQNKCLENVRTFPDLKQEVIKNFILEAR